MPRRQRVQKCKHDRTADRDFRKGSQAARARLAADLGCRIDRFRHQDLCAEQGASGWRANGPAFHWINGSERRFRIGSWPDWSATAARAEAREIRQRVDRGEDRASDREPPNDMDGDPAADFNKLNLKNLEQRITNKALAFLNQNLEPACYLYRHYHPSGDLLYVGISLDAVGRQRRHMKGAVWHNMICRIVIEPFETREQASYFPAQN